MRENAHYIIWFPLWYPNRTEPFSGDFIQRHALAASAKMDIEVVIPIRDLSLPPGRTEEIRNTRGRLTETLIYYNVSDRLGKGMARLNSYRMYNKIVKRCCGDLIQLKGKPIAVHAHVFGKNAMAAMRLHKKLVVPLFYTEHATFFLRECPEYCFKRGSMKGFLFKKFMGSVTKSSFVSEYLASCVGKKVNLDYYSVIPNVVDDGFFKPAADIPPKHPTRFIHISTLGYQKNFEDIIRAFENLSSRSVNFELAVFGPVSEQTRAKVKSAGLEGEILFYGEQPHEKILPVLQSADALLLYSRYETFGCVVIEANSCGVPVIVSDIPVMHELVREGENGFFVTRNDPVKLADCLFDFIRKPLSPDKQKLHHKTAELYGMKRIGQLFEEFYGI